MNRSNKQGFGPVTALMGSILALLLMAVVFAASAPGGYSGWDANAQASANSLTVQSSRRNERIVGFVDATVNSTFATTSYADLPLATVTYLPMVDPNQPAQFGSANRVDLIEVSFSADVSKATATSGTCALFVNGAVLVKTERTSTSAAGSNAIDFTYVVANTTTGSQTVKIQCKSGDTNVFTVADAHLIVRERW